MNNVIVSPHYLSTSIGSKVFAKGGNAVDAAIATNLIQGIVAPETCGIGGDLFALVWIPGEKEPYYLDAAGYAGSGVNPEELKNFKSIPLNHPMSVTVPGAIAGWFELSKKFGKLDINDILNLGIELCHNGFEVSEELHSSLNHHVDELSGQESGYSFYRNEEPLEVGSKVRRVQLGKTLEMLANNGLMSFYNGEIANSISKSVNNILTQNDLENFKAIWRKPLKLNIYGYDAWTTPPPTQGYLTLSALRGYELLDNGKFDQHKLIETYRAFAADRDRITYDYKDNVDEFPGVDDDYINSIVSQIDNAKMKKFNAPKPHGGGTAYMTTVDESGMGVSLIQSNFYGIGSRIGVGNYGFFLHNRGCGFNLDIDHPNYLQPGNKPLHTLSPTLWTKDNILEFIIGTRGGRYQPQLLAQVILPYIKDGIEFSNIMTQPRWTIDYFQKNSTSKLKFEKIDEEQKTYLESKGHEIEVIDKMLKGNGPISTIYKYKDSFHGVADIRVGTESVFSSS